MNSAVYHKKVYPPSEKWTSFEPHRTGSFNETSVRLELNSARTRQVPRVPTGDLGQVHWEQHRRRHRADLEQRAGGRGLEHLADG